MPANNAVGITVDNGTGIPCRVFRFRFAFRHAQRAATALKLELDRSELAGPQSLLPQIGARPELRGRLLVGFCSYLLNCSTSACRSGRPGARSQMRVRPPPAFSGGPLGEPITAHSFQGWIAVRRRLTGDDNDFAGPVDLSGSGVISDPLNSLRKIFGDAGMTLTSFLWLVKM